MAAFRTVSPQAQKGKLTRVCDRSKNTQSSILALYIPPDAACAFRRTERPRFYTSSRGRTRCNKPDLIAAITTAIQSSCTLHPNVPQIIDMDGHTESKGKVSKGLSCTRSQGEGSLRSPSPGKNPTCCHAEKAQLGQLSRADGSSRLHGIALGFLVACC